MPRQKLWTAVWTISFCYPHVVKNTGKKMLKEKEYQESIFPFWGLDMLMFSYLVFLNRAAQVCLCNARPSNAMPWASSSVVLCKAMRGGVHFLGWRPSPYLSRTNHRLPPTLSSLTGLASGCREFILFSMCVLHLPPILQFPWAPFSSVYCGSGPVCIMENNHF